MSSVLQEMLGLPQTPPSLVFLLTEKLLSLIPDDHRRIQTVGCSLHGTLFLSSVSPHPSFPGGRDHLRCEGADNGDQPAGG